MRKYCFLPVESTPRELDYKLNMARYLCAAGFDVIIGNPPFIRDELKYKNYTGVFLEKGLNPTPEYYKLLKNKGILLYDHADEGVANPVYSISYQPTIDALHCMEKIFLWGEGQKQELIRRNPNSGLENKFVIIGNPAFDLCSPTFRTYHIKFKPKSIPDEYILINTNFASINGYDVEEHMKGCTAISPESYNMMLESYTREEKQFEIFKNWLQHIFAKYPQENFVIRPHPSEIKENYEKLFVNHKNVFVSKEGNANQIIAAAKMVLHKDCTTALQSYLMGVPVISLGGEIINNTYEKWSIAFGVSPKDIAQAELMIDEILQNKLWSNEVQSAIDIEARKVLEKFFHATSGGSKAIVNTITENSSKLFAQTPQKIKDRRTLVQKIKLIIRKLMPLHYKVAKVSREILVPYSKKELQEKLTCLESLEPLGNDYQISWLFPNTYKISKRNA